MAPCWCLRGFANFEFQYPGWNHTNPYEIYGVDNVILETILMQKNKIKDGHIWILGFCSFRVIRICES